LACLPTLGAWVRVYISTRRAELTSCFVAML